MLKLSKKSDYALIALKHLAVNADKGSFSASDIAESYGISAPLMAKVLQKLARVGIVTSRYGSSGGYMLARDARLITAFEAIDAIDGPLSLTSCVTHHGDCEQTKTCTVKEPLRKVNNSILAMLNRVTISEMADDAPASEVVELRV
jgi:FeS assembly SUF system regulator